MKCIHDSKQYSYHKITIDSSRFWASWIKRSNWHSFEIGLRSIETGEEDSTTGLWIDPCWLKGFNRPVCLILKQLYKSETDREDLEDENRRRLDGRCDDFGVWRGKIGANLEASDMVDLDWEGSVVAVVDGVGEEEQVECYAYGAF